MASRKLTISIDEEAADLLLELAGNARKQGDFIAELVRAESERRNSIAELPIQVAQLRQDVEKIKQQLEALKTNEQ